MQRFLSESDDYSGQLCSIGGLGKRRHEPIAAYNSSSYNLPPKHGFPQFGHRSIESLSVIARVVVRLSSRSRSHSKLTDFFRPEPEKVLSVNSETGRYSTESFTGVALWFRCLMYDHRLDLCLVEES